MRILTSYFLFLVLIKIVLCAKNVSRRIGYGTDPSGREYPYITQALLKIFNSNKGYTRCTATILSKNYILTAGKVFLIKNFILTYCPTSFDALSK